MADGRWCFLEKPVTAPTDAPYLRAQGCSLSHEQRLPQSALCGLRALPRSRTFSQQHLLSFSQHLLLVLLLAALASRSRSGCSPALFFSAFQALLPPRATWTMVRQGLLLSDSVGLYRTLAVGLESEPAEVFRADVDVVLLCPSVSFCAVLLCCPSVLSFCAVLRCPSLSLSFSAVLLCRPPLPSFSCPPLPSFPLFLTAPRSHAFARSPFTHSPPRVHSLLPGDRIGRVGTAARVPGRIAWHPHARRGTAPSPAAWLERLPGTSARGAKSGARRRARGRRAQT